MSGRKWPASHPTDRRACLVCNAKPVVMRQSQVPEFGRCSRCGTPYQFRTEVGDIVQQLVCALDPQILSVAIEAWGSMHMQIHLRPWLSMNSPTCASPAEAHALGIAVGDPLLTPFEIYLDECRRKWRIDLCDPALADQRLVVRGRGREALWVRQTPKKQEEYVHGTIHVDPADLPEGTKITIEQPDRFPG